MPYVVTMLASNQLRGFRFRAKTGRQIYMETSIILGILTFCNFKTKYILSCDLISMFCAFQKKKLKIKKKINKKK